MGEGEGGGSKGGSGEGAKEGRDPGTSRPTHSHGAPGLGSRQRRHRALGLLGMAGSALRENPARTGLSTLGIIIGVAGLVAILAFADGLESTIVAEAAEESDLHRISISSRTSERVDNVTVPIDPVPTLDLDITRAVQERVGSRGHPVLTRGQGVRVRHPEEGTEGATHVLATTPGWPEREGRGLLAGRDILEGDLAAARSVAVLSHDALDLWGLGSPEEAVGARVQVNAHTLEVVGVMEGPDQLAGSRVLVPFTLPIFGASESGLLPTLVVGRVAPEELDEVRQGIEEVLEGWAGGDAHQISVSGGVLESALESLQAARLVIGAIIGVSILVGGIGIMNVMLASVLQRTREIGIKLATGARRRDILFQFLYESVAVCAFGTLVGLLFGFGIASAAMAIIRQQSGAPVTATLAPGTLLFVAGLAIVVGLASGAYPATRAARLRPAEAIRRE